ncbi:MAG: 50S ribosomal protein L9 [Spirochaetes bacterium GWC2_52_13]|nr:MAG: 50S ribosomal protein L9 [Spirochaetes bacterium GWC2_52_13]OHD66819.1 MAG: 50S ribosomal protein L9 [Spirochaetes bacterium GWF2_52_7]
MKIILNQDVHNLGEEGDVVVVKDGYARNFLLPKGYAVLFNKANQSLFASRTAAIEKRKEEKRKAAASVKEQLDSMNLTLVVSAGESGKLFGSVTNAMVQEALAKNGIEVERKRIEVATHAIKMVGSYSVKVRLYEGESAQVKIEVISESIVKKEEAEKAAAAKAAAKAAAAEAKKQAVEAEEEIVEEVEEEAYGAEGVDEEETEDDEE